MKIFNTLTRKKEELKTLEEGKVKIYACGPTVYNYIHIGNARPLCVFDILRRYLEYRGYDVTFVQNFTDIDDKIIKRANEEGVSYKEISEKYIKEFWTDAKGLNVREATIHPKATENIDEIIDIVSTLIEKGYAYEADGDVYFSPKKFSGYGKLSHQPLEELEAGARIMVGEIKREPMDFALWKKAKPGEPYWESPWGQGRPGWHIECSAMNRRYLGKTIDIHCGGQDLIFPHHENEIAQSECCNDAPFANYWMHNGYITVDNVKMSKSLNNFFTVRDIAKHFPYEVIRFFILNGHYRSPINFSDELMKACQNGLERIKNARKELNFYIKNVADTKMTAEEAAKEAELNGYKEQFEAAMDDDFNTADAVSAIYELVRFSNTEIKAGASKEFAEKIQDMLDHLCGVLGIAEVAEEEVSDEDVAKIEALISERTEAKKAKDFAKADAIRDELAAMGITIKDTRQGVQWFRG
jgi:cysteinyl-tRNA synthetase